MQVDLSGIEAIIYKVKKMFGMVGDTVKCCCIPLNKRTEKWKRHVVLTNK